MVTNPPPDGGTGAPLPGEIGRGPLGRATVLAHRGLVLTVLFVLTSSPGLVGSLLVAPGAAGVPLLVLCLVPLAPALSATLFAWGKGSTDPETSPSSAFWRGYRLGVADALRVAVPALLVLGVIAWTVLNISVAGTPPGYAWVLLGIGAAVLVIALQALVIATFFRFRARDLWRLAAFHTFRLPLVTLAVVALLVCVGGLLWVVNEAGALLGVGALAGILLRYEEPLLTRVREQFTADGDDAATGAS